MKEANLYNGTIKVVRNDDHKYFVNGFPVVGTTTVTRILDKPLVKWALGCGQEAAKEILYRAIESGTPFDEALIKRVVSAIGSASDKKRDAAADSGTLVHDWIERYIRAKIGFDDDPPFPEQSNIRLGVDAFLSWERENHVRYISSERLLYSKSIVTCGTLDVECELNAVPTVLDFKTGKALVIKGVYVPYKEYKFQTAAYTCMRNEEETGNPLDGIQRRVILNLSKETGEFHVSPVYGPDELRHDWETFALLRQVWERLETMK